MRVRTILGVLTAVGAIAVPIGASAVEAPAERPASGGSTGASAASADSTAASTRAFNAFFHTQNKANLGADVLAMQHLVKAAGHDVPTDGVFEDKTDAGVRAFQQAKGLDVDGITGPVTWGALATTLKPGATGEAVKALQVQLNAKRDAKVEVNGTYDAATETAVKDFQSHAGISADGIAGPATWKNLVWHYDYPDFEAGLCDQDPDDNGKANWGTGAAIAQLEQAVRAFDTAGQGQVPLGDVSKEHGGDIGGHASHEVGLDVDIWPVRTDSEQCSAGRITWRDPEYDRDATRALVKAIRAAAPGHIKYIWFNDPELISEGLTSEYANHDNHLHIRYCEKVHPSSLYTC